VSSTTKSEQASIFLDHLGDSWYEINKNDLGKRDPISDLLEREPINLGSVLEVGACNGWRLEKLRAKYGCKVVGIDPSVLAAQDAAKKGIEVKIGTADWLPWESDSFDTVIMGFCLYVVAPEDWFKVIAETDRVLKDGGHLIIWDYTTPRSFRRKLNREAHLPTFMYHIDWPEGWLFNPMYRKVSEHFLAGCSEMVTVMRKNKKAPMLEMATEQK